MRTLVTPSPFDAFLGGDDRALPPAVQAGLRTFMQVGCAASPKAPYSHVEERGRVDMDPYIDSSRSMRVTIWRKTGPVK